MVDDTYQVRLEITVPNDERGGKGKPSYKIVEVLRFIPAGPPAQQLDLEKDTPDETKRLEGPTK